MKDRYVYPAVFDCSGEKVYVSFPDFQGCFTYGDDQEKALIAARDVLALFLYDLEKEGAVLPEPSSIGDLVLDKGKVVVLVDVYMPLYRRAFRSKGVNTMVTPAGWLKDLAKEYNVNLTEVLNNALVDIFGLSFTSLGDYEHPFSKAKKVDNFTKHK
jgi:predicted RNase H-like HicB family nuclease